MVDLKDKFTGCLVGVGVGDALGMPVEGMSPEEIWTQFGKITDYQDSWLPKGSITDDTQMTICIAESFVERGKFDPEDLANRFIKWLNYARGRGLTCTQAVYNLMRGKSWRESGIDSAGNGSAMRACPIGLFCYRDYKMLKEVARLSSIITHTDPMAVAGATAVAYSVAYCINNPNNFKAEAFIRDVADFIADISQRISKAIKEVINFLNNDPREVLAELSPSAFILESLPAALFCFARSPYDFEETVITAVNGGQDADTVAAIAGGISGALNGLSRIPQRWIDGLEEKDNLMRLGRELLKVVQTQ